MQDFQSFRRELINHFLDRVRESAFSKEQKTILYNKIEELKKCNNFQELAQKTQQLLGNR